MEYHYLQCECVMCVCVHRCPLFSFSCFSHFVSVATYGVESVSLSGLSQAASREHGHTFGGQCYSQDEIDHKSYDSEMAVARGEL